MKQTGLPVIGIPAGDTSALEDKMLSALARLAALEGKVDTLDTLDTLEGKMSTLEGKMSTLEGKMSTLEGKMSTLEGKMSTLEDKMSTLEGKMSTLEGKMSTLEGKVSTLEGKMGTFQDALNLAPMILYNAEDAEDAVVKVLAPSDDTEKVSFEYAVVADYKPGSQNSYRFSRATYTGATTTREGVFISVPAGSSLLVRSLTAATWASGISKYNKFEISSPWTAMSPRLWAGNKRTRRYSVRCSKAARGLPSARRASSPPRRSLPCATLRCSTAAPASPPPPSSPPRRLFPCATLRCSTAAPASPISRRCSRNSMGFPLRPPATGSRVWLLRALTSRTPRPPTPARAIPRYRRAGRWRPPQNKRRARLAIAAGRALSIFGHRKCSAFVTYAQAK